MLITIQCPTRAKLTQGLWTSQVILGMDTEVFAGNTFEIATDSQQKVNYILSKCDGKVVGQAAYKIDNRA